MSDEECTSTREFATDVAKRLCRLTPLRSEDAKRRIDELLRSFECSLLSLPDHLFTELFLLLDDPGDLLRLSAVSHRLRQLAFTQRRVWRRFQRINVVVSAYFNEIRVDNRDGVSICAFGDERRACSAFAWLFDVCRPDRLRLDINVPGDHLLKLLVRSLPPRDRTLSIERLELNVEWLSRDNLDAFEQLLRRLPTAISHLRLRLEYHGPELGALLGRSRWLHDCTNLVLLSCPFSTGRDATITPVLPTLAVLPNLTTLHFAREISLLNSIAGHYSRCNIHLCCWLGEGFADYCQELTQEARKNVRSMCCIDAKEFMDAHMECFFTLFPNCRTMELDALSGDPGRSLLASLVGAYSAGKRENDEPWEVTLHIQDLAEPTEEAEHFVRLKRRSHEFETLCAIGRNFN